MERENEIDREKRNKYLELLGGRLPDAIFVLPAEMEKRVRKGGKERWSTTSYASKDSRGFMAGGKARVIATAELFKYLPEIPNIVACSVAGSPEKLPDMPTQASVLAQDLKRYGVDKITLEEKSYNTQTTLIEMVKLAYAKRWNRVAVLSSAYHIDRLKEMFGRIAELAGKEDEEFLRAWRHFQGENPLEVVFVGAENVLPQRSAHYQHLIERVEKTDVYKERVEAEARGIEDLRQGRYR